jgi:aminotransferase EvaB
LSIKVWDYLTELETEKQDVFEGIEKVLRSGRLILGESVKAFEHAFAEYCGAKHGIGVDNGTNALFLALKSLGIGPDDEVITVANTAVPTVSAIVAAGATPVFVDVHHDTLLMDVSKVTSVITPQTRAIVPVHLFGQCVDMDAVLDVAARHSLAVIEDASQSHGAEYRGRVAGSMGNLGIFSFYPTKPLGAFGDAGLILTSDDALDARLRRLRYYGMETTYYAEENGYNSRLDELHAEILLRKLKRLDANNARRRAIAARYDRLLADTPLERVVTAPGNVHGYYLYVVAHPARDHIIKELATRDIHVNVSYPWPIHTMRGYRYLGYKEGDLPVTEAAAKRIFSLPMYPALTDTQQDAVSGALHDILAARPA